MAGLVSDKERKQQLLNAKEPILSITDQDGTALLDISIRNNRLHMTYDKTRMDEAAKEFVVMLDGIIKGKRIIDAELPEEESPPRA